MRRFAQLLLCVASFGLPALFTGCAHRAPVPQAKVFRSKDTNTEYSYVIVPRTEKFEKIEPAVATGRPSPDDFRGTDRKAAKTSIPDGEPTVFADLSELLRSKLLLADKKMIAHNPPISKAATSDRVPEENHIVTVTGFLYATAKENDNDFHCIIGTAPGPNAQFFNVEVSGLPQGQFRQRIRTVRQTFSDFFGDDLPDGNGYRKFSPPIKVRLTGPLFFDIDHKAGVVGPQGMRPKTAWEIHPVSEIVFEPKDQ